MDLCHLAPTEIQSDVMNTVRVNDYKVITICYLGIEAPFSRFMAKLDSQTKGFKCCALEVFLAPLLHVMNSSQCGEGFFSIIWRLTSILWKGLLL
jgi:hypothetical protein